MNRLFLAPFVIAQRLPRIWLESTGLTGNDRPETERMINEKVSAFHEGMMAAQVEMMKATMDIAMATFTGGNPAAVAVLATERVTNAAMRPAARTVRANAKRLSRG